jgi:hypothetical protein
VVLWNPFENRVVGNVVEGSGIADLAVATVDPFGTGETTDTLRNCFGDNDVASTAPVGLQELAPCTGQGSGGDWDAGALDLLTLFTDTPAEPADDAWQDAPVPPAQESMPGARTAPAVRFRGPVRPDVSAIAVPDRPPGS